MTVLVVACVLLCAAAYLLFAVLAGACRPAARPAIPDPTPLPTYEGRHRSVLIGDTP